MKSTPNMDLEFNHQESFNGDASLMLSILLNMTKNQFDPAEVEELISDYMRRDRIFNIKTEIVLKCCYFLLMFSGILTNIIIIVVIASSKKLLKSSSNLLLLNLFVSDLLLCIFCMPFTLMAITRRSWSFGTFMCKLVPFLQAVTTFVSAATITSIAIDRMIHITTYMFTSNCVIL